MSRGPKNPLGRLGFEAMPRPLNGSVRSARRSPPPTRPRRISPTRVRHIDRSIDHRATLRRQVWCSISSQ